MLKFVLRPAVLTDEQTETEVAYDVEAVYRESEAHGGRWMVVYRSTASDLSGRYPTQTADLEFCACEYGSRLEWRDE